MLFGKAISKRHTLRNSNRIISDELVQLVTETINKKNLFGLITRLILCDVHTFQHLNFNNMKSETIIVYNQCLLGKEYRTNCMPAG